MRFLRLLLLQTALLALAAGKEPVDPVTRAPNGTAPSTAAPTLMPTVVQPAAVKVTPPPVVDANPDPSLLNFSPPPESVGPSIPNIEGKGLDDTLLPLKLPGYELRVLDVRKKLLYNIRGEWVQASLPVYFYYPTEPSQKEKALGTLRKVYEQVLSLGEKPQWSASEFRNLIVNLDSAIVLLENSQKDAATATK